ncbi:DUF6428 family protein [Verrucomicrobiota bacterium sgz303538]
MTLSEFRTHLDRAPQHLLRFVLPDGGMIEPHAHITEVGRIEKTFIDCGGTVRRTSHCSLQAWVADDTEHRLAPIRLASILDKAAPILGEEDLDVEIEYQDGLISQFPVVAATIANGALVFQLTTKNTDCLAKELCTPQFTRETGCNPGSGCC